MRSAVIEMPVCSRSLSIEFADRVLPPSRNRRSKSVLAARGDASLGNVWSPELAPTPIAVPARLRSRMSDRLTTGAPPIANLGDPDVSALPALLAAIQSEAIFI